MLLALGATYLAGILTVAGLLLLEPTVIESWPPVLWILTLIPLGVISVHPTVLRFMLARVVRWTGLQLEIDVPTWGSSLRLVARHIPAWAGIGLATWLVAAGLSPSAPIVNIMLAAVLAWVVGFLVIPAPGGLGVREAVFVLAATSLSGGVAAAVALLSRVLFILVDSSGAVLFGMIGRGRSGGVK